MMTADEVYKLIAGEIQDGKQDVSTWTRAFAEADGDEAKTKARYIRLRVIQLQGGATAQTALTVPAANLAARTADLGGISALVDPECMRDALAQQLAESGRHSLYSQLNLSASNSDADIQREILTVKEKEALGAALSAEEKYAIQTLGDPVSREQYDRRLLDTFSQAEHGPPSFGPPLPGKKVNPANLAAVVALIAIAAYSGLGVYREQVRKETEIAANKVREAAVKVRESAVIAETNNRSSRREADEALAVHKEEVRNQALALAAEREMARQREIDYQRNQAEEHRQQAEQQKARMEVERNSRMEQENARRAVAEAEQELCMTARRNNNLGAAQRYCKW